MTYLTNLKKNWIKVTGFALGLVSFFFVLLFLNLNPQKPAVTATLAVALLMAVWWIFEVVPLAITSLLPIFLFPMLGIMDGKTVSSVYFNDIIFLFVGGFMVALAMQRWNLHKRIALRILMFTGTSPAKILLGFMLATAFLSMWISNTATTMMMIPILLSIIEQLSENLDKRSSEKFTVGLLLGVAYSASIGGVSTLVGTPPNPMFVKVLDIIFPNAPEISFSSWFLFAFPLAIVIFIITWAYLYLLYKPLKASISKIDGSTFVEQYQRLGKPGYEEKIILTDFILMAILWMTRSEISIGSFSFHGWANLFSKPAYFNDGTVAILMGVILYFIPSKSQTETFIMNWEASKKLPWDIVLLFGGGFALAIGFKQSGLSEWFGNALGFVSNLSPLLMILIISIVMTFLTELTSNTATTQIILPIMGALAVSLKINPLFLMIPATISASMAFMLPVATPPNAIIFSSNKISIAQMAKTGFVLNIICAILITLFTYYYAPVVFHISLNSLPAWAH
ncbi:MAG: SLC13/DASS family transporter [Bacteroidales bacterium]|nr:SLC13/DASS family transporter [Bacteroidales bacterium]